MSEGEASSSASGKTKGENDFRQSGKSDESSDDEYGEPNLDNDLMRLLGAARRRQHILEKQHAELASAAADPPQLAHTHPRQRSL